MIPPAALSGDNPWHPSARIPAERRGGETEGNGVGGDDKELPLGVRIGDVPQPATLAFLDLLRETPIRTPAEPGV